MVLGLIGALVVAIVGFVLYCMGYKGRGEINGIPWCSAGLMGCNLPFKEPFTFAL